MRYFQARVAENRVLGGGYFVSALAGCRARWRREPGQFVMIRGLGGGTRCCPVRSPCVRRARGGTADVLAKTVGRGTALLERSLPGGRGRCARARSEPVPDAGPRLRGSAGRRRRRAFRPCYMQGQLAAAPPGRAQRAPRRRPRRADLVLLREMENHGPGVPPDHRGRLASDEGPGHARAGGPPGRPRAASGCA